MTKRVDATEFAHLTTAQLLSTGLDEVNLAVAIIDGAKDRYTEQDDDRIDELDTALYSAKRRLTALTKRLPESTTK